MTGHDAIPRAPRYGTHGLHHLIPTLAASVGAPVMAGGDGNSDARTPLTLPLPKDLRAVILLVVDGLGDRQLRAREDLAPFLAGQPAASLDAPYPTSTVTSLTGIGTGLPPGRHGIVSYSTAVPDQDRPLVLLTWSWERQDLGLDARQDVPPESYQPTATLFERLQDAGVPVTTVLRPEFATSGLTRAGLRGGRLATATDLAGSLDAALTAVEDGARIVYAHHGDLDAIGHVVGPYADPWVEELVRIDQQVAEVAARLPSDVAVVVTADHGMVRIGADGYQELADQPELLEGIRVLAGEPRARQLHVRPGAAGDVVAAWRESTAGAAHVATREEAIREGWFGPVADHVRDRIGDVLVTATASDMAWVHRDRDPFGGRLVGMHGALTPDEVEVPAIVVTAR